MKEKQNLPTKFYTLVLTSLGRQKPFLCLLLLHLESWEQGQFQKRILARQTGLRVGAPASWSCMRASKAESREMSIHVMAQVAAMDRKSWSKKSSMLGAVQETGVPSDCPI